MKTRNFGLRLVEVLVLGGLLFGLIAPLFSGEEEGEEKSAIDRNELSFRDRAHPKLSAHNSFGTKQLGSR